MFDINVSKALFCPSLICLDMCNLEAQVKDLEKGGIEILHIDLIDGHFSPSMPLGLDTVRQLRGKTSMFFDCHLMSTAPDFFIEELIKIGVQQITFHIETCNHADMMLNKIHSYGIRAGVALKPATSLSVLDYIIEKCDVVLLMLINPGYAFDKTESQVIYADSKIRQLKSIIDSRQLITKIEIDGRVSYENIQKYSSEYVSMFVCGTTCFDSSNIMGSIAKLKSLCMK